jgi:F-type H+-transporting ATPase subunit delta
MADNNTIARPYARAAFDLAERGGRLEAWSEALSAAAALLADGQLVRFLGNPTLTDDKRLAFLHELVAASGSRATLFDGSDGRGTNFLKLLLEYGRIDVLPEIAAHFDALKARVENTVDVTVTSATPLGAELERQIAAALKARLGRDVRLTTATDASLIGGAVIRAGDVVIDGSLRARLDGLGHALVA